MKILNEKLGFYFDQVYHNVCQNRQPPIYSDLLRTDRIYEVVRKILFINLISEFRKIRDYEKLKSFLQQTLQRYNQIPLMLPMDLVMFDDAILNICRILRVFKTTKRKSPFIRYWW